MAHLDKEGFFSSLSRDGLRRVGQGNGIAVGGIKFDFNRKRPPHETDDANKNFFVGSEWIDEDGNFYKLVDSTPNNAVWKKLAFVEEGGESDTQETVTSENLGGHERTDFPEEPNFQADEGNETGGEDEPLPDDTPQRNVLITAGISSVGQLRDFAQNHELTELKGVGSSKAKEIEEWLNS